MLGVNMMRAAGGSGQGYLITANTNDLNLMAIAGNPTVAGNFTFIIATGVLIGHVSAAAALVFGQFPAGSKITLINQGIISGRGGAANSGAGGDAVKLDYPSQSMFLLNSGTIRSGGGGGGRGGQGGGGYYQAWTGWFGSSGDSSTSWLTYYSGNEDNETGNFEVTWQGVSVISGSGVGAVSQTASGLYIRGSQYKYSSSRGNYTYYQVKKYETYYTTGGIGGYGGVGQGFSQSNTNGVGGAAGGTNAGGGGTGGTGGTWAANGGYGSNGAAGNNGAGGSVIVGGQAGKAIRKSSASFTILTNSGTILGAIS